MFTGLVEELGKVKRIVKASKSIRISIYALTVLKDIKLGDSIAVNGTCLTVVDSSSEYFTADVMPETVERTVLAMLKPGDLVNLERTLRVGDRLGGHIVTGHVDGIGNITSKETNDNAIIIKITASLEVMKYIIKKGSIAVDGISLTVVAQGEDWFTVSLIPHTAKATTLGTKGCGAAVNLETDIIGKYVERLLSRNNGTNRPSSGLTMDILQAHGFTM